MATADEEGRETYFDTRAILVVTNNCYRKRLEEHITTTF